MYDDILKKYEVLKIKGDETNIIEDTLINEYPFTLFIDDEEIITLLCTPRSLKELAVGFLYSEGFIESIDQIDKIQIDEEKGRAYLYLKYRKALNESLMGKRTITSGCGKGTIFYNVVDSFKSKKIQGKVDLSREKVASLSKEFNVKSEVFKTTGGVHSCAISDVDKILYFEEDIGRHNALDKILGRAFLDRVDLKDKIIVTSGRITSEIVIKAAKREIPVIISRSAATSLAVDMASELQMQLIGFSRGNKMNIYTNFPSEDF